MVPLERIITLFIPSGRPETSEPLSHARPTRTGKQKAHSNGPSATDPIRTGILVFLTLFLALMAVATLAGGIIVASKSDKIAMGLFAIFAGTLKGMLSVTKLLIR